MLFQLKGLPNIKYTLSVSPSHFAILHLVNGSIVPQIALAALLIEGVFERHPGLVVIVEGRTDKRYFKRLSEALPPACGVAVATRRDLAKLLRDVGIDPADAALLPANRTESS